MIPVSVCVSFSHTASVWMQSMEIQPSFWFIFGDIRVSFSQKITDSTTWKYSGLVNLKHTSLICWLGLMHIIFERFHHCIGLAKVLQAFITNHDSKSDGFWKESWAGFWQLRNFWGIKDVFQRRTNNNPWHSFHFMPVPFFSLMFLFSPWSLFAADLQVKKLTSAHRPLTHWVFFLPKCTKSCQPSLSYSTSLTHSISIFNFICFQLPFLSFPPLWYSPLPIPPFALLFSSLSCCLELLISLKVGCSRLESATFFWFNFLLFIKDISFLLFTPYHTTLVWKKCTMEGRNFKTVKVGISMNGLIFFLLAIEEG